MVDRQELMGAARGLVPVLRERARKTEQLRRVPEETIRDIQDAGLFKVLQPACYGGYEADLATYFDIVMALSAADGSVGWVYSVLLVQTWGLSLMDPRASEEVWGTDPSTLMSSASAPRSGYIDKVADGYRIAGLYYQRRTGIPGAFHDGLPSRRHRSGRRYCTRSARRLRDVSEGPGHDIRQQDRRGAEHPDPRGGVSR